MTRKIIRTEKAPAPGGHYSQAVRVGNQVYVAGSGPFNPLNHKIVPGGIREQTRQTLDNIAAILSSAGGSLRDVAKVSVFLRNMDDFEEMDEIFAEYFPADPPARTTVQAVLYGKDRLIVIDAVAQSKR